MLTRFRFFAAAFILGLPSALLAQRFASRSPSFHLNRPGVEAYMQGGAFAASTGNVAGMLFNPAGMAQMPGRLTATIEAGWVPENEPGRFFDNAMDSQSPAVQFAGIVFQPRRWLAVGAFYSEPVGYDTETNLLEGARTERHHHHGARGRVESFSQREQINVGLALAASFGKHLHLGGGVEVLRSGLRERALRFHGRSETEAMRFSLGAVLQIRQWAVGLAARTPYYAAGEAHDRGEWLHARDFVFGDEPFDNEAFFHHRNAAEISFAATEPTTLRIGVATPYAFGRLRLSADAEYKNFTHTTALIERSQFYGGGTIKLANSVYLGLGAFTFRNNFSAALENSQPEIFSTVGGLIELAQFRFTASFMDNELFPGNAAGQQVVNFAIGYVMP